MRPSVPPVVHTVKREPEWWALIGALCMGILWRAWDAGAGMAAASSLTKSNPWRRAEYGELAMSGLLFNGLLIIALGIGVWICVKKTAGWGQGSERGIGIAAAVAFIGFYLPSLFIAMDKAEQRRELDERATQQLERESRDRLDRQARSESSRKGAEIDQAMKRRASEEKAVQDRLREIARQEEIKRQQQLQETNPPSPAYEQQGRIGGSGR